jgi:hypothetical protein
VRSAWINKLLFAQTSFVIFERHREEEFTPVDFSSVQELSHKFEKFAERLHDDREFLESDGHWLPQVEFFEKVSDYDVVLETSELSKLEIVLANHLSLPLEALDKEFPRFNETESKLVKLIGTARAWDLISMTYEADCAVLSLAGLNAERPDNQLDQGTEMSAAELSIEKEKIRESRRRSEVRSLKITLADHDERKKIEFAHLEEESAHLRKQLYDMKVIKVKNINII